MTEGFEAFYISARPRGETSAWVTFFSIPHGLITAYCRGAKSPKKIGLMQPFMPLWLKVSQKGEQYFIEQIEPLGRPYFFQGIVLMSALYMNELITAFMPELEPHKALYSVYQQTLKALEDIKSRAALEFILRQFEFNLLRNCGYALDLTQDVNGHPVQPSYYYNYCAGTGLVIAKEGIPGLSLLMFLQGQQLDDAALMSLKHLMRATLAYYLNGRSLKIKALMAT